MKLGRSIVLIECAAFLLLVTACFALLPAPFNPPPGESSIFGGLLKSALLAVLAALGWFCHLGIRYLVEKSSLKDSPPRTRSIDEKIVTESVSYLLVAFAVSASLFLLLTLWTPPISRHRPGVIESREHNKIMNIKLICMMMLAEADKRNFQDLFATSQHLQQDKTGTDAAWNTIIPALLRSGRNAKVPLEAGVLKRLDPNGYWEVDNDYWGQPYQFTPDPEEDIGVRIWSFGEDGVPSEDDITSTRNIEALKALPSPGTPEADQKDAAQSKQ